VPAYTLFTRNDAIFNNGSYNLSDYISVVYQQTTYNSTDVKPVKVAWYNSTLCSNVIDNAALNATLNMFYCPDIKEKSITLQGDSGQGTAINLAVFTIIVDTCEKLNNITKKTDCQAF
jgi:hypothetical protein